MSAVHVHHDAEMVGCKEVDDEVVDHAAVGIEHAAVERFARHGELGHVIGQQGAQVAGGVGPGQVEGEHVRDVEHAGVGAHGVVLFNLRAVVHRHVPAGKIDHAGAGGNMRGVQRGV